MGRIGRISFLGRSSFHETDFHRQLAGQTRKAHLGLLFGNAAEFVGIQEVQNMLEQLEQAFPALVDAPVVYTRRCLYCDTLDEDLWIDRHPELDGLTVAAGDNASTNVGF